MLYIQTILEEILEKGDEVQNKRIREGIANGKDLAYLSKKLVTIDCNVPCNFHLENFVMNITNNDKLTNIFQKLELNRLNNKLLKLHK